MAMRLYHRRSSASKDRLQVASLLPSLQSLSAGGPREGSRPRSQSLFPGSENTDCLLSVPIRSRSRSLSVAESSDIQRLRLTDTEEDNIFRCYARIMYAILGGMAAALLCVIVYAMLTVRKVFFV